MPSTPSTPTPPDRRRFIGTVAELFLDVRFILALTLATLVGVFTLGMTANARADERAAQVARDTVKPDIETLKRAKEAQDAAIVQLKADFADVRADVKDMKSDVHGLREDFRLREKGRPLPPLPPVDGGTP